MLRDPIAFADRTRRRYGDIYTVPLPGFGRIVFVASPELAKQIFTGDPAVFHGGEGNAPAVEPVVGSHSLLVLDEDEHLRARKILLPPFHGQRMQRHSQMIPAVVERDIATWPVGEPFALLAHTQRITLEVILRAIFGIRDENRLALGSKLGSEFAHRSTAVSFVTVLRHDLGRFSPWGRFKRARRALDEFIGEEIAQRSAETSLAERDDLLSLLLQATHEDGTPLSLEEMRDQLVTMIGAGHDTTSTSIAWALDLLLHNPRALKRLRESIAAGEDGYLEAAIKETLRMRPVLSEVARKLTRPTELGGYELPAGTVVMASIAALHHRDELYPDPQEFRPERFLDDDGSGYRWVPFGGGTRRCLGAPFALEEMRIVLRAIVGHTELRPADAGLDPVKLHGAAKAPARGVRVVLERAPAAATEPVLAG